MDWNGKAMIRMTNIGVKTGADGEIRKFVQQLIDVNIYWIFEI